MWCAGDEREEWKEKSMPALFMEINRQYGMRCMHRIREMGIQQGQMPIIMMVYKNMMDAVRKRLQRIWG